MDVYLLDDAYNRVDVIDVHESLVWTDKYADFGTLEWIVPWTTDNASKLIEGTLVSIDDTNTIMEIYSIVAEHNEDGQHVLDINARDYSYVLDERVAKEAIANKTPPPGHPSGAEFDASWVLNGPPITVATDIFTHICVDGVLSPYDIIGPLATVSPIPTGNLPAPSGDIRVSFTTSTVGSAIRNICETSDTGYRLILNKEEKCLYFEVYVGSDRTSTQQLLPAVVFSPQLENISSTKLLTSNEDEYNVAYVISDRPMRIVLASGIDPTSKHHKRKILLVDAGNVPDDIVDVNAFLDAEGQNALAKARPTKALEGELTTRVAYQYNKDYFLGDRVELRDEFGTTNHMMVTENTIIFDAEGKRSYPTLVTKSLIEAGSWNSWEWNIDWQDAYGDWNQ